MIPRMGVALAVAISTAAMPGSWAVRAQTAATSQTAASAQIMDPVTINVTQNMTFTILASAVEAILDTGVLIWPATVVSYADNGANAQVVASGGGNALSVAAPASIDVTRTGSGPVTCVRSGGIFTCPVTITGTLNGAVLSFSAGGAVALADSLVPGNYHGVLTVVAQYN